MEVTHSNVLEDLQSIALLCYLFSLFCIKSLHIRLLKHAGTQRGGGGGGDRGSGSPLKNHKNIEFLRNTGPEPLEIYKATMPAFNVGPSSTN